MFTVGLLQGVCIRTLLSYFNQSRTLCSASFNMACIYLLYMSCMYLCMVHVQYTYVGYDHTL